MATATAPTVPSWITPGAPVAIFFGTVGITMPMAIEQGAIEAATPFIITLADGSTFNTITLEEIDEDMPFRTCIVDPAADETISIMDRFNKKRAMEDPQSRSGEFQGIPFAESAHRIIDSLQGFI
jgi:hypothetical protein